MVLNNELLGMKPMYSSRQQYIPLLLKLVEFLTLGILIGKGSLCLFFAYTAQSFGTWQKQLYVCAYSEKRNQFLLPSKRPCYL